MSIIQKQNSLWPGKKKKAFLLPRIYVYKVLVWSPLWRQGLEDGLWPCPTWGLRWVSTGQKDSRICHWGSFCLRLPSVGGLMMVLHTQQVVTPMHRSCTPGTVTFVEPAWFFKNRNKSTRANHKDILSEWTGILAYLLHCEVQYRM